MPLFSIITPTYKKATNLRRAIDSVLNQNHTSFEIIIINDSPDDTSYADIEQNKTFADSRIRYYKNDCNKGVNFSRNRALDLVSEKSDWIIFLDDDDYLAEDALNNFSKLIHENKNEKWFVCNRATDTGISLTHISGNNKRHNYAWNFLITKRFKGDATHCIQREALKHIYFSKTVKQADEWLFFYQLSLQTKLFYHDFNATITDGYEKSGLNQRKRTTIEQLKTLTALAKEGYRLRLLFYPTFILYLGVRFIRSFLKT